MKYPTRIYYTNEILQALNDDGGVIVANLVSDDVVD